MLIQTDSELEKIHGGLTFGQSEFITPVCQMLHVQSRDHESGWTPGAGRQRPVTALTETLLVHIITLLQGRETSRADWLERHSFCPLCCPHTERSELT